MLEYSLIFGLLRYASDGVNIIHLSVMQPMHPFQEIKIQEQLSHLTVGSIPRSMVIVLEDDLGEVLLVGTQTPACNCTNAPSIGVLIACHARRDLHLDSAKASEQARALSHAYAHERPYPRMLKVDRCKPGDDLVVVGVVSRRWKTLAKDMRPEIDMVLVANHVKGESKGLGFR